MPELSDPIQFLIPLWIQFINRASNFAKQREWEKRKMIHLLAARWINDKYKHSHEYPKKLQWKIEKMKLDARFEEYMEKRKKQRAVAYGGGGGEEDVGVALTPKPKSEFCHGMPLVWREVLMGLSHFFCFRGKYMLYLDFPCVYCVWIEVFSPGFLIVCVCCCSFWYGYSWIVWLINDYVIYVCWGVL